LVVNFRTFGLAENQRKKGYIAAAGSVFHYKTDTKGTPQFGLIAEEVVKVNAAPVLPDKEGEPYTVRCDTANAMLLNEFLKEHRIVQEQEKRIDALTAQLKAQAAQSKR
jgi:hypothetical protein